MIKKITEHIILCLFDADEHLDIKINRFGIISTTPMWKAYFTRWWIVLEAKVLGFRWVGGAEIKKVVFYLDYFSQLK